MGEIQWSTNINYLPALIGEPTVYSLGTAKNRRPAKFLGNRPGTVSGTVTGTGSPLVLTLIPQETKHNEARFPKEDI